MFVLSRKSGEKIVIDGDIHLEVLEVTGSRVRLGITAPNDRRIMRVERRTVEPERQFSPASILAGAGI